MIYIGLFLVIIVFVVLFLTHKNKYLNEKKKFREASMLLKKWNVYNKEEVLIEKQKKRKIKI